MSLATPRAVRERVRADLWARADALDWVALSDAERSAWYERWSKDKEIGGVLSAFMDPRRVRVYIKDALFKPYRASRQQDDEGRVRAFIGDHGVIQRRHEKPAGRLYADGTVVVWGGARQWKSLILSAFLRGVSEGSAGRVAVMFAGSGSVAPETRSLADLLAAKLEVNPIWAG